MVVAYFAKFRNQGRIVTKNPHVCTLCQMAKAIELSIVIPVFNSADIFPELYTRISNSLSDAVSTYEIIAVVDGGADNSADVIADFCERDGRVRLVEFSRNFGHQAAVTAGLEFASGEMVVIMDDDLEDPPELLPDLIARARSGYDVVYGIRRKRKISLFKQTSFFIFYRVLNWLADIEMPYDAGDFCLMKRPVVDTLNSLPESNRYIRGLRSWLGFKQAGVEYERGARYAGESGYSLPKYIRTALNGVFAFSYRPLTYVSVMGFVIAFVSFVLGTRLIILKLTDHVRDVPGWASLMVATLFLGGIQLISVGVLGQYIARIYDEVKGRPQFVVKRRIGFSEHDESGDAL